eukprot:g16171.t1
MTMRCVVLSVRVPAPGAARSLLRQRFFWDVVCPLMVLAQHTNRLSVWVCPSRPDGPSSSNHAATKPGSDQRTKHGCGGDLQLVRGC